MGRFNAKHSSALEKPSLSHFLCLPLVNNASRPQFEQSFHAFRNATASTENGGMPPVHPKAIRPVGTLHLTLGVMSLTPSRLSEAVALLTSIDVTSVLANLPSEQSAHHEPEAPPAPLCITLKALDSMHPPQKTSILYSSPIDATNRLYPFCLALQKLFKDKGFLVEDDRGLKLHATVINTIYSKGRKKQPRPKTIASEASNTASVISFGQHQTPPDTGASNTAPDNSPNGPTPVADPPLKIDARNLLEEFKDHVWAQDFILDRVAICEMGAKKITDEQGNVIDEKYHEVAAISLPS